jgi:tRNA G26 N,N-dimethylase Trm1
MTPQLLDHPPLYCAHCGEQQTRSIVMQSPPAPTVCMACGRAVKLAGPLWLERLSELAPEAAQLQPIRTMAIRMATQRVREAAS